MNKMNNKDKLISKIHSLQDSIAGIDTAINELQITRDRLANILKVMAENLEVLNDAGLPD